MKKVSIIILLIACSLAGSAQAPRFKARLDSFMAALDKNHKSMCAVTVTKNGTVLYNRAIGFANTEKHFPADTTTMYEIGSISKMFTAVIIFQLIDEGKVTLEDKLSKYLPQIPGAADISIEQMLRHRSGIYSITSDTTYGDWNTKLQTRAAMLKRVTAYKPAFSPDSKTEYSNTNFLLLSYIIEDLTGKPYGTVLKERIINRLRLKHTANGDDKTIAGKRAASYSFDNGEWAAETVTDPGVSLGAGSVLSTPADLDRFITGLFSGRLISAASLAKMTTIKDRYGMGIFPIPFYDRKAFGHTGRIDGFSSSVGYFPADSTAFSVIVNGQNYPLNDIGLAVLKSYYGMPFPIPDFKEVAVAPELLKSYEGEYASADVPLKITVSVSSGKLQVQATGQGIIPMNTESNTRFSFEAAGIVLDFPSAGKMILHQGGAHFAFARK